MNVLDRGSGMPLYRQIEGILAAELRESDGGSPIMTEQELIQRFGVSRATVRHALKGLVDAGLVYRDRAKGTFPVQRSEIERPATLQLGGLIGYLADQGLDPSSEVSDVRREVPDERVASALRLRGGETVLALRRRVFAQGSPLSLAEVYLRSPEDFLPTAEELEEAGSAIALFERHGGPGVARAEHHVWAIPAGERESAAIGVEVGAPVLEVETLMRTREGAPVVWRRIVDRAGGIRHVFHVVTDQR